MSKRRWIGWFILGFLGTGLVIVVLYALLSGAQSSTTAADTAQAIRDTQKNNHQLLKRIAALSHSIDDCTKPGGKCFERGQRQTGKAVSSISREAIVRSACTIILSKQTTTATQPVDLTQQIASCIKDTLAELPAA